MKYLEVCQKIREQRLARGLSQVELARKLGISKSVISSYENAVHLPPYDILIALSKIFGVSCDYLLGSENNETVSVAGLTQQQKLAIQAIIDDIKKLNDNI